MQNLLLRTHEPKDVCPSSGQCNQRYIGDTDVSDCRVFSHEALRTVSCKRFERASAISTTPPRLLHLSHLFHSYLSRFSVPILRALEFRNAASSLTASSALRKPRPPFSPFFSPCNFSLLKMLGNLRETDLRDYIFYLHKMEERGRVTINVISLGSSFIYFWNIRHFSLALSQPNLFFGEEITFGEKSVTEIRYISYFTLNLSGLKTYLW